MAEKFLDGIKFGRTAEVCEAIRFHVKSKTQRTALARILWDADKLSFYSEQNGQKLVKVLVGKGMSEEACKERLKHDWNFYY